MFNWFKRNTEVEEKQVVEVLEEKPTTIYKRLEVLESKLWEIKDEGFIVYKFYGWNTRSISLNIPTALGERRFWISKDSCVFSTSPTIATTALHYELTMYNGEDRIFYIKAYETETEVEPIMTRDGLTSKEIDLAIYELEQYIDKFYSDYKDRKDFHSNEVKKLEK